MARRLIPLVLAALLLAPVMAWGGPTNHAPVNYCSGPRILAVGGQSFMQLLDAGHYKGEHPEILPQNFPLEKRVRRVITYLCQFNRGVSSETALEAMAKHGLRAARADECLAFGATFKDHNLYYSTVVCLGALLPPMPDRYKDRLVLVIGGPDSLHRLLWLGGWKGNWSSDYQFLAVRE